MHSYLGRLTLLSTRVSLGAEMSPQSLSSAVEGAWLGHGKYEDTQEESGFPAGRGRLRGREVLIWLESSLINYTLLGAEHLISQASA